MSNVDLKSLRIDQSLKGSATTPARSRAKWWIVAIIVVAVVIALWLTRAPTAVTVQVMRVAFATTQPAGDAADAPQVVLDATGYIVAAHKIELAPKVVGRVLWVGVEMGDKVKKGDVLVRLEDDEYRARAAQTKGELDAAKARLAELEAGSRPQEISEAQAQLESAQADLQAATLNVERLRKLAGSNAISAHDIDDAEARFSTAKAKVDELKAALDLVRVGPRTEVIAAQRAQVEQMQGQLDLSMVDLSNTVIRAPIDGTILERNVEVGEYVTTGFVGDRGAKGYVVSLADLSDLRVELDIGQSDFPKIAMGQHGSVTTDAYPDRKYDGAVDQIAPEANRQKATVLVKVKILQPDDLLRPDMNASVGFHRVGFQRVGGGATQPSMQQGATPSRSVTVPASAVHDGKVFVVEDGKAVERAVDVSSSRSENVRVTRGLEGGELVIVNPPTNLQSGQRVNPQEQSGATGS